MARLRVPLFLLLLAALVLVLWPHEPEPVREPINGRLPPLATPDHYQLRLNLFPEQASFRGEVEIGLQLHAGTRVLYLHGRDLQVHRVEARRDGKAAVIGRYQQLSPQGLARIDFADALPPGFVTILLQYDGRYTQTSEGLSRIKVGDDWYAFSQFHPIEARRVFPAFDEPNQKATFELEVISWQQDVVIGNSLPSETRQLANGLKITRFNRTPRLPTFLVNISVGPFDVVNGPVIPANTIRSQPLSLRAVTTRGNGIHTGFALRHTAAMLTAFENYFAIPYPFEKLDLVAVPDSSASVLENPGAIHFRDQLMLIDESSTAAQQQDFIAHHAHALAHQWFGNLVTMPWWDDLWLNEGFAEWLGYEIAASSYPGYPFAVAMQQQLEQAMRRDGLSPALRIQQPVSREQDVQSTFNTVVYDKAMGLMRMYQRFLGAEQFRLGLRTYFARHAFGNAGADELFRSLGDVVADPGVTQSFDSFLAQSGLPEISLTLQCENNALAVILRQREYTPAGRQAGEQQWQLPVCLRAVSESTPRCLLLTERERRWSPGWRCDQLPLANADGAGYYRWQISDDHRQRLLQHLPTLPLAEALDIVANLDAGVRSGQLDLQTLWQAMPALARHPNPIVLDASLDSWSYLLQFILPAELGREWRQQLQHFFAAPALQTDNSASRQRFRVLLLQDRAVRKALVQANGAALRALERGEPLPSEVPALALAVALEEQPALWPVVRKRLADETQSAARGALIEALAMTATPATLPELQLLLLSPHVRVHERWSLLQASLREPVIASQQWPWLQQHLDALLGLLPDYRHSQLPQLAETLCDGSQWPSVRQFLQQHGERLVMPATTLDSVDSHVQQCLSLRGRQPNPSSLSALESP